MDAYTGFAYVYDEYMDNIPYEEWGQYMIALLKESNHVLIHQCLNWAVEQELLQECLLRKAMTVLDLICLRICCL